MKKKDPTDVLVLIFSIVLVLGGGLLCWFSYSTLSELRGKKRDAIDRRDSMKANVEELQKKLQKISLMIGWKERFHNIVKEDGDFTKSDVPPPSDIENPQEKAKEILKSRGFTETGIEALLQDDKVVRSVLRSEYVERYDRGRKGYSSILALGLDMNMAPLIASKLKTVKTEVSYPMSKDQTWKIGDANTVLTDPSKTIQNESQPGPQVLPLIEWYRSAIQQSEKAIERIEGEIETIRGNIENVVGDSESQGQLKEVINKHRRDIDSIREKIKSTTKEIESLRNDILRKKQNIEAVEYRQSLEQERWTSSFRDKKNRLKEEISQLQSRVQAVQEAQETDRVEEEAVDGEVLEVNLDNLMVYIDIGKSDGLLSGREFDVFELRKGGLKVSTGKIKVTEVHDGFASAEILDMGDARDNPISQGDFVSSEGFNKKSKDVYVFAGTMFGEYNRDMLAELIRDRGNSVEEKVTNETTFLVVGKNYKRDSNYQKAIELGIRTINQKQLERVLGIR